MNCELWVLLDGKTSEGDIALSRSMDFTGVSALPT